MTDKNDNETPATSGVDSSEWFAPLGTDTARRRLEVMKGYLPSLDKYCKMWPSDIDKTLKLHGEFILGPAEAVAEEIRKSRVRSSKMNNGYTGGYITWSHELDEEARLKALYWVITGSLFANAKDNHE